MRYKSNTSKPYGTYSNNNRDLAYNNSLLQQQLKSSQKLSQNLWIQHVADRVHLKKIWKDGWLSGYKQAKEDVLTAHIDGLNLNNTSNDRIDINRAKVSDHTQKWLNIKYPKDLLKYSDMDVLAEKIEKCILSSNGDDEDEDKKVSLYHGSSLIIQFKSHLPLIDESPAKFDRKTKRESKVLKEIDKNIDDDIIKESSTRAKSKNLRFKKTTSDYNKENNL